MGLIAGIGAASGTLRDSSRGCVSCDPFPADALMRKAKRRPKPGEGDGGAVPSGSVISVSDGQCAIVVRQRKVVELCAEPGEFVFDSGTEPSFLSGDLDEGILDTFRRVGRPYAYADNVTSDLRACFINIGQIADNGFAISCPYSSRQSEPETGTASTLVRCTGTYSFRIVDPLLFFENVAHGVPCDLSICDLDAMLTGELVAALGSRLEGVSASGNGRDDLPGQVAKACEATRELLRSQWLGRFGIDLTDLSPTLAEIAQPAGNDMA